MSPNKPSDGNQMTSSTDNSSSEETLKERGKLTSFKKIKRSSYNERLITKIHNKYYDLTDFKHPGGPIPIGLIENRDGTELFESHHLFTNKSTMDILESYEMNPAPIDTIESHSVYDWTATKESAFTKEL
jgi:cytochrome b involved in lipid metabolism